MPSQVRTPPLRLLKVGGSLLTDKYRFRTPNRATIERLGRAIVDLGEAGRNVVYIAGGGSFGNGEAHPEYVESGMTLRLLLGEWRDILERGLADAGAQADVVLARDLWSGDEGRRFDPAAMLRARSEGRPCVLLGDQLVSNGRTRLLSSDLLPILIASQLDVSRVVMVTDVEGVRVQDAVAPLVHTGKGAARIVAGRSEAPDATGGMRRKVHVLHRLALAGIEGVVCGPGALADLRPPLFTTPPPGTFFVAAGQDRRAVAC